MYAMKIFYKVSIVVLTVVMVLGTAGSTRAATQIDLGAADGFAVLAGSAIVDSNPSVIVGNVGLSPAAGSFIGLTTPEVTGTVYAVDSAGPAGLAGNNPTLVNAAKVSLTAAYTNASNQIPASTIGSELNGAVIHAGVYNSADGEFHNSGTVTLDAQGDPNAVFIFNAASTFTTAANSVMVLANSAQACNVYWRIGSSTGTLGTNSIVKGNLLADQSITDAGGSIIEGRLLARIAAVTLNNTHVTVPTCAAAAPAPAPAGGVRRDSTITVVKTVINDNGKTKMVADFPLFLNGVPVTSGVSTNFPAPLGGTYTVTEPSDPQYTRTFSGDCDANGQVTLSSGENRFCVVTNNDVGAPAVPIVPPLIDVVKVPSPLALPGGPGPVTYTYTVRNVGTVPVTNVTMVGDTCSPITLISGDTNGDSILQTNETWRYTCTTTLTATHTNTVVATGWANGISAVDIASATVVVGEPIVPPLIHVTKLPSPLALHAGGGAVTYTYIVTNPGTAPLSDVSITDDKCTGLPGRVVGHPGDLNHNNLLESNEAWQFTCQTNLSQTTTNIGTAQGSANGLTARDFAIATVVVAAPGLPRAGASPVGNDSLWLVALAGILAVGSLSLVSALRERRA